MNWFLVICFLLPCSHLAGMFWKLATCSAMKTCLCNWTLNSFGPSAWPSAHSPTLQIQCSHRPHVLPSVAVKWVKWWHPEFLNSNRKRSGNGSWSHQFLRWQLHQLQLDIWNEWCINSPTSCDMASHGDTTNNHPTTRPPALGFPACDATRMLDTHAALEVETPILRVERLGRWVELFRAGEPNFCWHLNLEQDLRRNQNRPHLHLGFFGWFLEAVEIRDVYPQRKNFWQVRHALPLSQFLVESWSYAIFPYKNNKLCKVCISCQNVFKQHDHVTDLQSAQCLHHPSFFWWLIQGGNWRISHRRWPTSPDPLTDCEPLAYEQFITAKTDMFDSSTDWFSLISWITSFICDYHISLL